MYADPFNPKIKHQEAPHDVPVVCGCCSPRQRLIIVPDELGETYRCPKTRNALRISRALPRLIIPGVWLGELGA